MSEARARWSNEHLCYGIPHLRLRQVAELVRAYSPRRVLDVGCATGHLRYLLDGVEYFGCDFAPPAAALDFEFHLCDLNEGHLPAELSGFDVVVCSGILEYLRALPDTLAEITGSLRRNGTLVCTYFNDQHALRQCSRLIGLRPYHHPDWVPLLSLEQLHAQLRAQGLRVRNTFATTCGPGPAPPVSATVDEPVRLVPVSRWTRFLAHQFVIDCVRAA